MHAWQVQGAGEPIDVLQLVDLEPPQPEPGQVRIRVEAAGIGLPDVLMCRGTYPLTPPLPFTSGQEATGTITATGDGVDLPIGARIMCVTAFTEGFGSFAEECLVPVDSAFAVPDGLTDREAAGFWIPHLTGWIGLVDRGRVARGEWLVVLGAAGGSGIAAVQLGRALGAHVIGVVSDEARASFCRKLGARRQRSTTPRVQWLRHYGRSPDGRGVDLIFDPVGGSLAEDAVAALSRHGRLLAVGFASGQWPKLATLDLVVTNTSLVGVFAGGYTHHELEDIHAHLCRLVSSGQLTNAVTAEVSFDELPGALQRVADRQVVGKLVMVP